jgi:redox-regulated HSP33 family molecular chaperone
MQIRCQYCHRPYAITKEAVHAALEVITAEKLNHYDANCPHCGKVNHVSRSELLRAAPNWHPKEDLPEA